MTTSDYPTRTAVLLDTVHEHDHEHEHDMNHEMDHNSYVRPMVSLKQQKKKKKKIQNFEIIFK
jgi:hypothetical protein